MSATNYRVVIRSPSLLRFRPEAVRCESHFILRLFLVLASLITISGRISKPPKPVASSTRGYHALSLLIKSIGFEVIPCSFCSSRRLKYRIIERTSKYAEYTRCSRAYDASSISVSAGEYFSLPYLVYIFLFFIVT
jgi:hypothetical protein